MSREYVCIVIELNIVVMVVGITVVIQHAAFYFYDCLWVRKDNFFVNCAYKVCFSSSEQGQDVVATSAKT